MNFDALIKLIPNYVDQLLRLVGGPQQFFDGRQLGEREAVMQSLVFFCNSAIIAFVLRIPFQGGDETYWQIAMMSAIYYLPTAIVLAALVHGVCRLAGGSGNLPGHATIFAYYAGVSMLIFSLASLCARGVIQAKRPEDMALYKEYLARLFGDMEGLEAPKFAALADSQEMLIALLVLGAGFVLTAVWLLVIWRVLGRWNKLTRTRSALALIAFLVIGYGISTIFYYVQLAAKVSLF